jgi:hypothetical protein
MATLDAVARAHTTTTRASSSPGTYRDEVGLILFGEMAGATFTDAWVVAGGAEPGADGPNVSQVMGRDHLSLTQSHRTSVATRSSASSIAPPGRTMTTSLP